VSEPLRISVLGAGNWGTTLAQRLAKNGHAVQIWSRNPDKCQEINEAHTSRRVLPGVRLADAVRAVSDLGAALAAPDLILIAVPSQSFRALCRALAPWVRPEHQVVHCIKGLERGSHATMSEVLHEETCVLQIGVLSGPNIAAEIAADKFAGTLIATRFPRIAALVRRALSCAQLRVFEGADVRGVELCGAAKNVIALAAGMVDALELGANAKAFLLTRGLYELTRLLAAAGCDPSTALGLAGCGDMMVTAISPLSRNHRVGVALGRGIPLAQAISSIGMVAEGVYAAESVCALSRAHALDQPLFEAVARVLREEATVEQALATLRELPTRHDVSRSLRRPA
jgi:glycerol-3-phosphate dehydrogenase (NAD(P)+)